MWTKESVLCACVFLCRFLIIRLYSGEGIYVFKGCIYPILPVTNTQRFWNIIKTDETKSKNLENIKGKWPCTCSSMFSYDILKRKQKKNQSFHKQINLYSLNFFSHHNWVLFPDFCCSFCFVIIWAVMLVRITVKSTKQVSTSAVKSCTNKNTHNHQEASYVSKL